MGRIGVQLGRPARLGSSPITEALTATDTVRRADNRGRQGGRTAAATRRSDTGPAARHGGRLLGPLWLPHRPSSAASGDGSDRLSQRRRQEEGGAPRGRPQTDRLSLHSHRQVILGLR